MKDMPPILVGPLVVAVILGAFSLMSALGSCTGALSVLGQQGGYPLPPELVGAVDQLMSRSQVLVLVSVGLGLFLTLPTSGMLLWGAFGTVTRRPDGGVWLARGFALALVNEAVMLLYAIAAQVVILGPMLEVLEVSTSLSTTAGGSPPPIVEQLGTITLVLMGVGLLFSLAWSLVKVVAMVWARRRVQGEEVRDWYAGL